MEDFNLKTSFFEFLESKGVSKEDFNSEKFDVEKRDELSAEYRDLANQAIEKAMEEKASKEDINALKREIKDAQEANVKAIDKAYKKMRVLSADGGMAENKTFLGQLKEKLEASKEDLQDIFKGQKDKKVNFTVKAPVVIGNYNTVEGGGSASQTSITQDTGIISPLRKRILTYLSNVTMNRMSVDEPFLMWMEELDEQGNPTFHGEDDTSPLASVRYEERRMDAKTVSVASTITKNFLRYTNQLYNFLQSNLLKRVDIVTENGLFTGNGTGDNLKGLIEYATAFDGGKGVKDGDGLVDKVEDATNWDVLKAVALQVYNSFGNASAIFIDSDKLAEMEISKDQRGNYIMPPFKSADGNVVSGMQLIPTTADLGAFDFVGGDLSAVNVGMLLEMEFEIGYNGTDLKDRRLTVVAERQITQFVSANDTQVLVKGAFEAGKALIQKP